jgi:RNA recognition motif-containing protein
VYICDIDQQVTEAQLAAVFIDIGPIVDCRVCGDPNSAMRFAFIEFEDEASAKNALVKNGTVLGLYNLRVLPSRTAIVPVNLQYLPQSYVEREQCGRTVYVANIDKKVDRNDVRAFFETLCGRVSKLRLLGDYQHATRIAFIEFFKAESAIAALNCSGALLGSLPIRVSPSKTPVRPDPVRAPPSTEEEGATEEATKAAAGEAVEASSADATDATDAAAGENVAENVATTNASENGEANTTNTNNKVETSDAVTDTTTVGGTEDASATTKTTTEDQASA